MSNNIFRFFNLDYLYHATYIPHLKEIVRSGYIEPGHRRNWDISSPHVVYLSRDSDDAASYAEAADAVPEEYLDSIVILKIDTKYLNFDKLDIDHNQVCDYGSDVDVEDVATWIDFEYRGKIPIKAVKQVIDWDSGRVYNIDKNFSLLEMADTKSAAQDKLRRRAIPYLQHLYKCVVFGDSTGDLYHWETEIANLLHSINAIKLKSTNSKPPAGMYEDYFFFYLGDERSDHFHNLEDFRREIRGKYPDFEITPKLVTKVFQVVNDFASYFASHFSKKNNDLTKDVILDRVVEYFED